jgi:hypothetical protein
MSFNEQQKLVLNGGTAAANSNGDHDHSDMSVLFNEKVSSLVDIIVSQDARIRDLSLTEYIMHTKNSNTSSLGLFLLQECDQLDAFSRQSENLYGRVRAFFSCTRFIDFIEVCRTKTIMLLFPTKDTNVCAINNSNVPLIFSYHTRTNRLPFPVPWRLRIIMLPFQHWPIKCDCRYKNIPEIHGCIRRLPINIQPNITSVHTSVTTTSCYKNKHQFDWICRIVLVGVIFFLGMDFPEGAKVLNVSVDLAVLRQEQTQEQPLPPIACF